MGIFRCEDEVSTGSGSDRVTSGASVIVKVRQFIALLIKHVVNCARHAAQFTKGIACYLSLPMGCNRVANNHPAAFAWWRLPLTQ